MEKIKVITDSTSYMSEEFAKKHDITVVPLKYIYKDKTFKEGYAGEFGDYFLDLRESGLFPTTSQPSTGEIIEAFEEALKTHDKIIAIFLSSKLSGTYQNALIAKDMLDNDNIEIIDSQASSAALRFFIEDAVEMIDKGKSFEEIIGHLEDLKDKIEVYVTVESLEYLARGGRLTSLEYKVGNVLKIKPIIELKNGELIAIDKTRGTKKAIKNMLDRIDESVKKIRVCHIMNYELAEKLKNDLEIIYPDIEISLEEIGPVIGSHLGPGSIGFCYY